MDKILVMKHYTENDHDKIVLHIMSAILTGYELDTPVCPPRNDGTRIVCLHISLEECFLIDGTIFQQLYYEGLKLAVQRAKTTIELYGKFN